MLNDAVNYVRQGVLIASALICIQHTEATCPKVCYDDDDDGDEQ
jgi:26S proteasome regulatory subunit N2